MGMDEALALERNQQVLLQRSGLDEQKVSRRKWTITVLEAGAVRAGEPVENLAVAQTVSFRRNRPLADRSERSIHQPDTIEPGRGIAAVKSERSSSEAFGGASERQYPFGHE